MSTMKKLGDEELEQVSGGYIFNSYDLVTEDGKNKTAPWEVLGEDGNILVVNNKELRFKTKGEAEQAARDNNVSDAEVTWEWVKGRRGIV